MSLKVVAITIATFIGANLFIRIVLRVMIRGLQSLYDWYWPPEPPESHESISARVREEIRQLGIFIVLTHRICSFCLYSRENQPLINSLCDDLLLDGYK